MDLSAKERMNMSLDEIILTEKNTMLTKENKQLGQTGIISLYDWVMHIDKYGDEYITGYKKYSDKFWETSNIKNKIPMSNYLLVVTENESLYRLPYYSSYN